MDFRDESVILNRAVIDLDFGLCINGWCVFGKRRLTVHPNPVHMLENQRVDTRSQVDHCFEMAIVHFIILYVKLVVKNGKQPISRHRSLSLENVNRDLQLKLFRWKVLKLERHYL
ncbi:hypothetical protein OGAPHI_002731 [Ogataea philodendri]|uniref:Uncharacterized protein n=1 Tax=Ogataea philodendri TaxID=1378263 RepID=A0A9P8T8G3_9ASCO|nr:uncharacterized protein OGAPHI_002731 [Ogataea philodendri]KAH3668976.1 hypothetical protein OGAPHI_002731 [Ogataea philodendri]